MKAGTMAGLEKKDESRDNGWIREEGWKQGQWLDERRRIKAGTMDELEKKDESRDDGWIREEG